MANKKRITNKEKIEMLLRALRFYANPHNWDSDGYGINCSFVCSDLGEARKFVRNRGGSYSYEDIKKFGGKRARNVLKKCGIKTPKSWEVER